MVLFQYWQVSGTAHLLFDGLTRKSLLILCDNSLNGFLKGDMQPLSVLQDRVSFSETVIMLLSLPAFQTTLWGWQWVLSVSQGVISQPENKKANKGWVGNNQKTDGETSTVRLIFDNPHYSKLFFHEDCPKTRSSGISSLWCHKGHWFLTDDTSPILAPAPPTSLSPFLVTLQALLLAYVSFEIFKRALFNGVCNAVLTPAGAHRHSSTRSERRCGRNGKRCACCSRERCPTCRTAKTFQMKYRWDSTSEQKLQVSWEPGWMQCDTTSRGADFLLFLFLLCWKSTARLRGVHDGLFTGQIDAVDTSAATYRVTFDRSGLGTHTVPDYEVLVRVFINLKVDGFLMGGS